MAKSYSANSSEPAYQNLLQQISAAGPAGLSWGSSDKQQTNSYINMLKASRPDLDITKAGGGWTIKPKGSASAGEGGGTPGGGGESALPSTMGAPSPGSDSNPMAGLQAAAPTGGADTSLRQGLGFRKPSNMVSPLAGLARAY